MAPKHRDARSLDHTQLERIRHAAVADVLGGKSQVSTAKKYGVHPATVWKWMDMYNRSGEGALASTKAPGPKPKLNAEQQIEVKQIVIGKLPSDFGFGTPLWTLPIIRSVIKSELGTALHPTNVGRTLRRLGLTPQKPTRESTKQDIEKVDRWKTEDFPKIVQDAKDKNATILFEDESQIREDALVGTTWGEKGKRPVVKVAGTRRRINVISAISPQGRLWFRCYQDSLDSSLFISFLAAILVAIPGHVCLIMDGHPAHVSAATKAFVESRKDRLTIYLLPAYAPKVNPDEHVWSYLKGLFRQSPFEADEDIEGSVAATLRRLQRDKERVRAFFEHPETQYIGKSGK